VTNQENKELVRRYNEEVWNGHNIEKMAEFVSEDMLEESIEHVRQFLTAFPDAHLTIKDLIGEGDKVAARLSATATNTGPFAGQPATGKKVQIHSIRIYRIADNKIVETWAMQDRLGLMEQLGLVKSAGGNVNWAAGEEDR
jgi:predicted ester cyclase